MRDFRGKIPEMNEFGVGALRRCQKEAYLRAVSLCTRECEDPNTVAEVVPGGGKSLLAALFATVLLRSGFVDRVILVEPRASLRDQLKEAFACIGLDMAITSSSIRRSEVLTHAGYITTYQALMCNVDACVRAARGLRTLIVLDEAHHLSDNDDEGKKWKASVTSLCNGSAHVLLMSGGLGRGDGARVLFVGYDSDKRPIRHISYTRRDALEEGSIIPLRVELLNGDTSYKNGDRTFDVELKTASSKKKSAAAVKTALEIPEFAHTLLDQAYQAWHKYRSEDGYRSSFIVVCDEQKVARLVAKRLREIDPRMSTRVGLAITDEGKEGADAVRRFQKGKEGTDILVTCRMAHEGLDAKAATHMAYLSKCKETSFLDQTFARLTRFNPGAGLTYEEQSAFVWAPHSVELEKYVEDLKLDQDYRYRDSGPKPVNGRPYARQSTFEALRADPLEFTMGGEAGIASPEVQAVMARIRDRFPGTMAWPAHEVERLARDMMNGTAGA